MARRRAHEDAERRTSWAVLYHSEAVAEFNGLSDKRVRKAVITAVDILRQTGPRSVEPHSKSVQGTAKLRELRPGGGRVLVRPLYAQWDAGTFVILAIGPEAQTDSSGFRRAVDRAVDRARRDFGWMI